MTASPTIFCFIVERHRGQTSTLSVCCRPKASGLMATPPGRSVPRFCSFSTRARSGPCELIADRPGAFRAHSRSLMRARRHRLFLLTLCASATAWGCAQPPAIGPGVRFAFRSEDRLLAPTNEEIALTPDSTAVIDIFEPRQLAGGSAVVRAQDVDFVTIVRAASD